eukprot:Blabericola_migrator_1__3301@NODE_1973_length_3483_cov_102_557377_g1256_i0_p1_GENE_NODE_1973_length_3483_cov_102_557377_g1256_i0NODE_1973_length_3483_cov_102_557377_g1256_i0_p1_ORF_typecomplete_len208_score34_34_NODE_1973_length_3483_cov_102_557377_g1256_i028083431
MNARAANVFVQQAQQSQLARPKHNSKAALLFTGVALAMTNDLTGAGITSPGHSSESPPWKTDVFDFTREIVADQEHLNEYLVNRRLLRRQGNTDEYALLINEDNARSVRDITDLVALNLHLDLIIFKRTDASSGRGRRDWYEMAMEPLEKCGKKIQRSPTQTSAVARLQQLLPAKIYHARCLQKPELPYADAVIIKGKYENWLERPF